MKNILLIAILLIIGGCTTMNPIIEMNTTKGMMTFELYQDKAPNTVNNFLKLAKEGFYDDVIFHRVIDNFMIQSGDPTGTGTGGPGYSIDDEFHPDLKHNSAGILSMANKGVPNSGGSQFFVTLNQTSWLDNRHSVFGKLIEGEDVLFKIGNTQVNAQDRPLEDIKILSIKIK